MKTLMCILQKPTWTTAYLTQIFVSGFEELDIN